jgi:DNA-binding transcriptional regulator GbsR (MarR family)
LIEQLNNEVDQLSDTVGEFIRYWGFKNIHGKVWCLLFLSNEPLNAPQLIEKTGVSKALMSQTLSELLEFQVVQCVDECVKNRRYCTNPKILSVITSVLRRREKEMLGNIHKQFRSVESFSDEQLESVGLSKSRVERLGKMISFAETFLNSMLRFESISFKPFRKIFD